MKGLGAGAAEAEAVEEEEKGVFAPKEEVGVVVADFPKRLEVVDAPPPPPPPPKKGVELFSLAGCGCVDSFGASDRLPPMFDDEVRFQVEDGFAAAGAVSLASDSGVDLDSAGFKLNDDPMVGLKEPEAVVGAAAIGVGARGAEVVAGLLVLGKEAAAGIKKGSFSSSALESRLSFLEGSEANADFSLPEESLDSVSMVGGRVSVLFESLPGEASPNCALDAGGFGGGIKSSILKSILSSGALFGVGTVRLAETAERSVDDFGI